MTMDKVIQKQQRPWWQWLAGFVVVGLVGWFIFQTVVDASVRSVRVPAAQLIISSVQMGTLEDVISVRGTVQPLNSVFLDAVNGGVVEQIFVQEGAFVEAGQPLLQLSNTSLRLSVANNDTAITEQLNYLTNIANGFETTQLNTEREIINLEYRITTLERQMNRHQELVAERMISQQDFEAIVDELDYNRRLLVNTRARQALENRIRQSRQVQIAEQIEKLEDNLTLAQTSFESLLVRAPISGQLTSLPVQIGESKLNGQRLGQIDVVNQYKVAAQIDEFYVSRVSPGQSARFSLSGTEYSVVVDRVYPEITNGLFTVDLIFDQNVPDSLRRGQTLQLELVLGSPQETLLLPIGSFVQETGGNWVFVLDASGQSANRREIVTGRRNNRFIEVREGLETGDRVITSGYSAIINAERVQLDQ
ncbi:efflux RND transporter periplasmic adaptor subunit [Pseudohongiella spirulinae]|uniref:RND transporter n=1 Tax=Pseudohongiella spirulinae TaxID=1249552 RepID=A0A0S2KC63_9GAMM|nr:HlyD family efflux transporter periplasmic adaptor subunit [Pseudohongiella spirulinae]ALO45765.1 RND transporter [Pseudohongiella spirulinae]